MIFESHAHYDDERFDEDREALIASLPVNGIGRVINVGASLASCRATLELIHKYDFMYGALGVHPSECGQLQQLDIEWIKGEAAANAKVVSIGEIGLDYHWEEPERAVQVKWFEAQLEVAAALKLPVIIHSRDADLPTQEILKAHQSGFSGGVIHCYSYSKESARIYMDMGYYIGVGGVVTFKNAKKLKETVEYVPMDRILLETDCPYMAPEPYRGRRNSSLFLPYVAQEIANIKGVAVETVIEVTERNAERLFLS